MYFIFVLQIQIQGWNSDIYGNLTHALYSNNGLAIIVLLVQASITYFVYIFRREVALAFEAKFDFTHLWAQPLNITKTQIYNIFFAFL